MRCDTVKMILSLVWLLLAGVWADCQDPPCLRLCCPLGQVRRPGSVPVAKHRCETDLNIPDFLPDCVKTTNTLQLVEATTSALRRYRNIKEENLLGQEEFSCPHISESLVLASQREERLQCRSRLKVRSRLGRRAHRQVDPIAGPMGGDAASKQADRSACLLAR